MGGRYRAPTESVPSLAVSAWNDPRLLAAVLGVLSLALFLTNLDFSTSGDSLLYVDIIAKRRFADITVHFGYYALVWALHSAMSVVSTVPLEIFVVYLNAVFGAAGAVVAFALARELLQSNRLALYCVILLVFSGRYFTNSTSAEMYLPQVFFLLLSYYLFLVGRPASSGVSAVVSVLISTLGFFSFLFYPVACYIKRYPFRHLLVFSLCVAAPYGVFFAALHHQLLWGTRGLLTISTAVPADLLEGGRSYGGYLVKHFGIALGFFALGTLRLLNYPGLFLTAVAVYVPNFYLVFKQPGADHLTMCTDFFFAAISAVGLGSLASTRVGKYVSVVLLAAYVGTSGYLQSVFDHSQSARYREDMTLLYQQVMRDRDVVVIMSWWDRIAAQYYNTDAQTLEWDHNEVAQHAYDEQWLRWTPRRPIRQSADLFVLESYEPSRFAKTVLSERALRERYERDSLRRRVERTLGVQCSPVHLGSLQLYRCLRALPGG